MLSCDAHLWRERGRGEVARESEHLTCLTVRPAVW